MGKLGIITAMGLLGTAAFVSLPVVDQTPEIVMAEPVMIKQVETFREEEPEPEITCHEMVMSYIEEDNAPFLVDTTAYCHGTVCSHGDIPRDGIVAAAPEWYGMACVIYEAIPEGDSYTMGSLIGVYEIKDTGYGRSSGDGVPSKVRSDKDSRGTIETGKCIDRYCENYGDAKEWMKRTGGKIFIQVMPAEG
ncbi:MAG: hypothetical protein J5943_03270 [Oribacterium sp.]|nr:hypothetical protein [Oribacterium sp.]